MSWFRELGCAAAVSARRREQPRGHESVCPHAAVCSLRVTCTTRLTRVQRSGFRAVQGMPVRRGLSEKAIFWTMPAEKCNVQIKLRRSLAFARPAPPTCVVWSRLARLQQQRTVRAHAPGGRSFQGLHNARGAAFRARSHAPLPGAPPRHARRGCAHTALASIRVRCRRCRWLDGSLRPCQFPGVCASRQRRRWRCPTSTSVTTTCSQARPLRGQAERTRLTA